ncbi:hypothetical protein CDAR_366451 [Caerostris darwini]|uniref:Uncharacterized protein n=1 Tax=Caerostris darwini TaxID=1538125 RepID=A0AAV4Q376_9ARAC|nr:hypothetical protein CDAR_366451 [Caerostris darwini]
MKNAGKPEKERRKYRCPYAVRANQMRPISGSTYTVIFFFIIVTTVRASGQSDTSDIRASHDSTELLGLPSVISKTTIAKPADISYKTTIDHMVPSSVSAGSSSMNYAGYGSPSSGLLNVPVVGKEIGAGSDALSSRSNINYLSPTSISGFQMSASSPIYGNDGILSDGFLGRIGKTLVSRPAPSTSSSATPYISPANVPIAPISKSTSNRANNGILSNGMFDNNILTGNIQNIAPLSFSSAIDQYPSAINRYPSAINQYPSAINQYPLPSINIPLPSIPSVTLPILLEFLHSVMPEMGFIPMVYSALFLEMEILPLLSLVQSLCPM